MAEDQIRKMCLRVLAAEDQETFRAALSELNVVVRNHIQDLENLGIHLILKAPKPKSKSLGPGKKDDKKP
jgi:hypothetical protein